MGASVPAVELVPLLLLLRRHVAQFVLNLSARLPGTLSLQLEVGVSAVRDTQESILLCGDEFFVDLCAFFGTDFVIWIGVDPTFASIVMVVRGC